MKNRTLFGSLKNAFEGLKVAFTGERNFRIHCLAAAIVIVFGILFRLSFSKWVVLFLTMGFVLVSEIINTFTETLVDMITKEYSKEAKKVKDLAAGAVLISAITAVLAGLFIFGEPVVYFLLSLFGS